MAKKTSKPSRKATAKPVVRAARRKPAPAKAEVEAPAPADDIVETLSPAPVAEPRVADDQGDRPLKPTRGFWDWR